MENNIQLNEHNKEEFPPMHTAEHILNGLMSKRYACGRAFSAHIERKKSKLDFHIDHELSQEELTSIENEVNDVIKRDLEVWTEYVKKEDMVGRFDLTRLPDDASETVRIVHVGDYDECLCIGSHVGSTSEIGQFRITSSSWKEGVQRLVYKLDNKG
ncbi:MAG: hypothetical protein Q4C30_10095 [Bacteroidia bacterium]|nr:hypothetical protein [Bacteroidia bacterium]